MFNHVYTDTLIICTNKHSFRELFIQVHGFSLIEYDYKFKSIPILYKLNLMKSSSN